MRRAVLLLACTTCTTAIEPAAEPLADPWTLATCAPMSFTQLVAKLAPGETTAVLGHALVQLRTRDRCNAVTGCPAWREQAPGTTVELTASVVGPDLVLSISGDAIGWPAARIVSEVVSFPSGRSPSGAIRWNPRVCSDGRFHFVTEGNELEQVAIYGVLW